MIIARNKGFLVSGSLGTVLATRAGAPIYSLHDIWRAKSEYERLLIIDGLGYIVTLFQLG